LYLKEPCWVCHGHMEERSVHHAVPTSLGGTDADYNRIVIGRACHDLLHFHQHPDTLFDRVNRVKQGSSRHRKFLRFVSHLSDPEKRDRILKLREVISLAVAGVGNTKEILEAVFPAWLSEELWKSPFPLKD